MIPSRQAWLLLPLMVLANMRAHAVESAPDDAVVAPATQVERPFLGGFLKESRVVYPLRIGAWEALGEHLYELQELGASVRYQDTGHPDRRMDVYFYPAGVMRDSVFEKAVDDTVAEMKQVALDRGTRDFVMDGIESFTIDVDSKSSVRERRTTNARSIAFRSRMDEETFSSAMAMTTHDLYFIKIRYSVPERKMSRDAVRRQAVAFLGKIVRSARIVSTGGCWMPLPIRRLDPGAPPPNDMQGILMYAGKPGAYVYQDHIVAPDPESAIAKVAMMMIMNEGGRLVWGCDSQESMNREVPDGMREIRLEFHAPEGDPDGQSRSPSRDPKDNRG